MDCPICEGKGSLVVTEDYFDPRSIYAHGQRGYDEQCVDCKGTGEERCKVCGEPASGYQGSLIKPLCLDCLIAAFTSEGEEER